MSIKLYNLYTNKIEEENVCAEGFMRFLYENILGKFLTKSIFKRAFFSRLCGLWADSKRSGKSILKFAADNNIDISESKINPAKFETFNDFFTRELVESARPVCDIDKKNVISLPSDGRHLLIENITKCDSFYTKGQVFDLSKFLGDSKLADRFEGGTMLISRLSPVDYHRFHYPISGEIVARKLINGDLFSVSPIALIPRISIFWENKRILNLIESAEFGLCAFIEIGATNVGSIENFGKLGDFVNRGEQAGMFRFGGSCVVTILPKTADIKWNANLKKASSNNMESYAKANFIVSV